MSTTAPSSVLHKAITFALYTHLQERHATAPWQIDRGCLECGALARCATLAAAQPPPGAPPRPPRRVV